MKTYGIVIKETLKIGQWYEAEQPQVYGGKYGNPKVCVHVELPEGMIRERVGAVQDEEGNITFEEVSEAVQKERNSKLTRLRFLRDQKLKEADIMVNEISLGIRSDLTEVKEYRQALKDITNDYKYANDSDKGKAALDNFDQELSDFVWPEL